MTGDSHEPIVGNLQAPFGKGFPFDQAMFDLGGFSGFQSPPGQFFAKGVNVARLVCFVAQHVLQRRLPLRTGKVFSECQDGWGV